jgi:hypothetical protein
MTKLHPEITARVHCRWKESCYSLGVVKQAQEENIKENKIFDALAVIWHDMLLLLQENQINSTASKQDRFPMATAREIAREQTGIGALARHEEKKNQNRR